MPETTPMMRQYRSIKSRHPDSILFFRLGDFYEMFEQDAVEASRLLDLTLTQRQGVPMCGVPYHAAQGYIGRLLKAGRKVAICEQLELPRTGIARREVIEVITPGTVTDENLLEKTANNYLVCVCRAGEAVEQVRQEVGFASRAEGKGPMCPAPAERKVGFSMQPLEPGVLGSPGEGARELHGAEKCIQDVRPQGEKEVGLLQAREGDFGNPEQCLVGLAKGGMMKQFQRRQPAEPEFPAEFLGQLVG